jgi:hypothetical protein
MNVEFTKEWCMDMAKHEGAAGDPDCSAGAAVAPLRAAAQVVALEPEGPDGHGVNWLAGKRPKPGDLLYGGDAVARALAAKNEAESRELKSLQELDEQREQLACVRQALPEEWRNSVPSVAVSTLAAEIATLREQFHAAARKGRC